MAVGQNVTASTQNHGISALLFLHRQVLKQDLEGPIDAVRAKQPERLPTVLTKEEVRVAIGHLSGTHRLMEGYPASSLPVEQSGRLLHEQGFPDMLSLREGF